MLPGCSHDGGATRTYFEIQLLDVEKSISIMLAVGVRLCNNKGSIQDKMEYRSGCRSIAIMDSSNRLSITVCQGRNLIGGRVPR